MKRIKNIYSRGHYALIFAIVMVFIMLVFSNCSLFHSKEHNPNEEMQKAVGFYIYYYFTADVLRDNDRESVFESRERLKDLINGDIVELRPYIQNVSKDFIRLNDLYMYEFIEALGKYSSTGSIKIDTNDEIRNLENKLDTIGCKGLVGLTMHAINEYSARLDTQNFTPDSVSKELFKRNILRMQSKIIAESVMMKLLYRSLFSVDYYDE